jgi:hypothetical protein
MDTEKKLIKKIYKDKTYYYDQNIYNKNFYEKHKDKIHEKLTCECCGGSYSYYNKSKHVKSKKHLFHVEKQERERQEQLAKLDDIRQFIIKTSFDCVEE